MRSAMALALVFAAVVAWASEPAPPVPALAKKHARLPQKTKCSLCHTPEGWHVVRAFPHDRTGFPLRGAHAETSCGACHPKDFNEPIPKACGACHRDVHEANFGTRCAACHDERSWRPLFDVDAHRRSNFPLVGAHAALPCEQCHLDAAERTFAQPARACVACHDADQRRAALEGLDHARAGFSTNCAECHAGWTFQNGAFPQHDRCFLTSAGPHGGISCRECHSSVALGTASGTCATNTAACTGCHEHSCTKSDRKHAEKQVPGYQCKDRKCYECHQFVPE